jgi:hypothetical protein
MAREPLHVSPAHVAALVAVNVDDMLDALGLKSALDARPQLRRAAALLCRPAAHAFAHKALRMDCVVGEAGLEQGAQHGLAAFTTALRVAGREGLPERGPLLVAANHPGMTDTLALFAAIARPDLRILAARRPFLQLLPNISRCLIYIDEDAAFNTGAVRAATEHLRAGGALLTFPGGDIEPDPAVHPGAAEALAQWSASLDLFARRVPEAAIVPALVRGVLSPRAQRSPLAHLRRTRRGREQMAAMLQLALPAYGRVAAEVRFGAALCARDLLGRPGRAPTTRAVVEAMQDLLDQT